MRMLEYKVCKEVIHYLHSNELYIIDRMKEIDEAVYSLKMRFYNLVLIYENDFDICIKLVDSLPKNNMTACVILTQNLSKKFELEILKKGALDVIKTPFDRDLILARIEAIHRNNFHRTVSIFNKLFLDIEYKELFDNNQKEIPIGGKAFDILKYLVQNEHRRVSNEELIQVIWKEPELIRTNLLEVHISILKGVLKRHFNLEFIDNIKRKGYRLSLQQAPL
jgi:two-component system, OmpR family, response regulator